MHYVLIIHSVKIYSAWKEIFDQAASIRKTAGDPNRVVHFSKWQSLERARAFFESPTVVEIRRKAGVEAPEFIYLTELEAGSL